MASECSSTCPVQPAYSPGADVHEKRALAARYEEILAPAGMAPPGLPAVERLLPAGASGPPALHRSGSAGALAGHRPGPGASSAHRGGRHHLPPGHRGELQRPGRLSEREGGPAHRADPAPHLRGGQRAGGPEPGGRGFRLHQRLRGRPRPLRHGAAGGPGDRRPAGLLLRAHRAQGQPGPEHGRPAGQGLRLHGPHQLQRPGLPHLPGPAAGPDPGTLLPPLLLHLQPRPGHRGGGGRGGRRRGGGQPGPGLRAEAQPVPEQAHPGHPPFAPLRDPPGGHPAGAAAPPGRGSAGHLPGHGP